MYFYPSFLVFPIISITFVTPVRGDGDYEEKAAAAIQTLQEWYDPSTGLWDNKWWQTANILTTLAIHGLHTPSFAPTASSLLATSYRLSANQLDAQNWTNAWYDDEGWWALAWIAAYDLTSAPHYLSTAALLFDDMAQGWTTPCAGGIWWDKAHTSIAAIANELLLSVAAHLATRVASSEDREYYLAWARGQWAWFSSSGVFNERGLVNDGIDQHSCGNDGKTVWTYNQGVILGALAELARATGESAYAEVAVGIAESAMQELADEREGVLTEKVPVLDDTSALFKGAFVRGLAALCEVVPGSQLFTDFLRMNAEAAWERGRDEAGVVGPSWLGELQGEAGAASHAAGVDVLVAAARVG